MSWLIGGDHVDLPLGFSESLIAWGTSLTWQVGHQNDIRKSSHERDAISAGIGWYLRGYILGVHGMAYVVGQIHEELGMVPHYHGPLLIDGIQGTCGTYTGQEVSGARGASGGIRWIGIPILRDSFMLG